MKNAAQRRLPLDPLYPFMARLVSGSAFAKKHLARGTAETEYEEHLLIALLAEDCL